MSQTAPMPWRVPVAVEDIGETGQHFDLIADEHVRAEVARMAGLRDLPRFEASFDVTRRSHGGVHVAGRISAVVGQNCVVTLEPLANTVDEQIDIEFAPPSAADHEVAAAEQAADEARETAGQKKSRGDLRSRQLPDQPWNEPERLVGGEVDLGALATEFLLLGLDPYPRKPGAVFEPPADARPDGSPFAVLAGLARNRNVR